MTRITFILITLLLVGCHQQHHSTPSEKLQHIVLVWLKESTPENQQKVIEASKVLFQIEELKGMNMGTTLPSDRDIVDDSYDVGYVMYFDDKEAMQRYLDHPIHVDLVKNVLRPSMKKVLVYDIVAQ